MARRVPMGSRSGPRLVCACQACSPERGGAGVPWASAEARRTARSNPPARHVGSSCALVCHFAISALYIFATVPGCPLAFRKSFATSSLLLFGKRETRFSTNFLNSSEPASSSACASLGEDIAGAGTSAGGTSTCAVAGVAASSPERFSSTSGEALSAGSNSAGRSSASGEASCAARFSSGAISFSGLCRAASWWTTCVRRKRAWPW